MRYLWLFLVVAMAAACGGSREGLSIDQDASVPGGADAAIPGSDGGPIGDMPDAATPPGEPVLRTCVGKPFTPGAMGAWMQSGSASIAAGAVKHSAQDQIEPPDATPSLHGRFAYGALASALPNEAVRVYLDECESGYKLLGQAMTDASGLVHFEVSDDLAIGVYEARLEVVGDLTNVQSFLWVLPEGTHIAVSDIDGTLTASDSELFQQVLNPSYVPKEYPDAEHLTQAHEQRGHVVVYLTGRFGSLTQITRDWLTQLGFAFGPVHVTDTDAQVAPTDQGVGTFKRDYLNGLIDKGYVLDLAYGNATTDIFAYLGAGLPADQVWIIGTNGGQMGTHAVADAWTARVTEVNALPAVDQPFQWP